MVNFGTEQLMTIAEVCQLLPGRRHGHALSRCTVLRWMLRGTRGVRLESIAIGCQRLTSREALERFIAAMNPAHEVSTGPVAVASSGHAEAEKSLDRLGI